MVTKYQTGNVSVLCCSHKRSCLHVQKDFIVNFLQKGLIQVEFICQLRKLGYQKINTTAKNYRNQLCESYEINLQKYTSLPTISIGEQSRINVDYITRKSIFEYLWMNGKLSEK